MEAHGSDEGLRDELQRKEEERQALYAQLQRALADFENYKKRMAKEREEIHRCAGERTIERLLEPAENLTRALEAARSTRSIRQVREGLEMVHRQLWASLEEQGLRRIETVGRAFDPMLHDALERVEVDGTADGTIVEEVQAGYTLNGRVLRYAKVRVARSVPSSNAPDVKVGEAQEVR